MYWTTLYSQAASVNGSYSFNCGTAPWWSVWDVIYLVGSIWNDWLFYLDTTQWWSNELPSSNDGKLYIRLWVALDATSSTFSFLEDRPIFYYDGGIKVYGQADNKQDVIGDLETIRNCACGALQNTIRYGCSLDLSIDNTTYVVRAQLKDQCGCNLGNECCIDLPLESVVVCGCYDSCCKEVELDLEGGSCIRFGIGDLVCGLQSEINCSNKLSSDLVDDTGNTNKFVTVVEKSCWNGKAEVSDIPTDNCQLGNSCWYTTCTWTLVASDLNNYAKCCDIPTDNCQLGNGCWYTTCTGTLTEDNICNATFGSSWDGVTTKAPSMNAVYDVLWGVECLLANI